MQKKNVCALQVLFARRECATAFLHPWISYNY